LVTQKEACERLSVGMTTLSELTRSGAIRTVKIGPRGIRVPESEIDRFVRERLEGQGG
jgi:excisionase family DNA binding protein